MKKIALIFLGIIGHVGVINCFTVYLNNKSPNKTDFFVHSSLPGCCYGCEVGGKCKVTLEPGQSGKFDFREYNKACAAIESESLSLKLGACIKCIAAKMYVGNTIVEVTLDLEKSAVLDVEKEVGRGAKQGWEIMHLGYLGATIAPATTVIGAVKGMALGAVNAIRYQCTDMEITLEGSGLAKAGYQFKYQKR